MERVYPGINPQTEEIARKAAGLAHDIKNMLTIVQGCFELIRIEDPQTKQKLPLMDDIENGLESIGQLATTIIENCFPYPGKQSNNHDHKKVLNLNELVQGVVHMQKSRINHGVQITIDLEPELSPIEGDELNIQRLLNNLVDNAYAAIPEEGFIEISSQNSQLPQQDKGFVCISIRDTGIGMDQPRIDNIFKPFFTTKPDGHGLGLPVVRQVAEDHGGWIDIRSVPGQGTQIQVYFPAHAGSN